MVNVSAFRRAVFVLVAVLCLTPGSLWADEPPEPPASEAARRISIRKLAKELRKRAKGPRATKDKAEILKILESLEVLGGPEAGAAALGAAALDDAEVRDKAFGLAETLHDPSLIKPIAALLEDKRYRQDVDARTRLARSLAIMADASAVPVLTELIRTDEYPEVVAQAAESLATYAGVKLELRKDAVKRLIDTYTSTWNLMMSIREEDKVISAKMREHWKIYGRTVRTALQALTGEQQLTRPQEWRDWWNDHKKRTDW